MYKYVSLEDIDEFVNVVTRQKPEKVKSSIFDDFIPDNFRWYLV